MLGRNILIVISLIVIFLSAYVGSANAATTPSFPVCANPQGEVISSYSNGIHGVAGDSKPYSGSDTVYRVSENNATQCLCASDGTGIQTNWWKVSELTQEEISVLTNQGWILIPDGSAWGLDQGQYLARNSNFSCGGSGGTSSSSENKVGGASAESISSGIFSLANTGNMVFILTVFTLGIMLLGTGLIFSFKNKR